MTTKVNEIVVDALEDLVVLAEEAKIPQSEARAVIRGLNDMMALWDAKGISLGYTEVSDLGDIVTVPPGAIAGIKANLSIKLAHKYEVDPKPSLVQAAKEGLKACLNLAFQAASSNYPPTLPQGSGNTYPGYTDSTFYPDQQDTILTETGGSIALEDDTEEA